MGVTNYLFIYIPWGWIVDPIDQASLNSCPSTAKKLGTFAAVNGMVTLLSLFVGNRKVVLKLTCGIMGKADSSAWQYMWIIGVGLQLGANALIAVLIKHTAGYQEGLTYAEATLFYTTRPRFAWIFLTYLGLYSVREKPLVDDRWRYFTSTPPGQGDSAANRSKDHPWSSSAKATFITEIVLGIISLSIYVKVVHHGITQGYYNPYPTQEIESHAKLMYTGALVYLAGFCSGLFIFGLYFLNHNSIRPGSGRLSTRSYVLFYCAFSILVTPWVGSWLFWIGYVGLAGKLYCPPNLLTQASLWVSSSIVGIALGAGF